MAQLLKNLPAMQETWVRSLVWEDLLEKAMATHSSILAWRIPWTTVHGVTKSWTQLRDFHFHFPYAFYSSHVWMWELNQKEGWMPKNWCFQSVVLEKTLESPLDSKEIKPVNPKGNQSWIFTGRTDAEAEAPLVWPPDAKSRLNGKDTDAGKDWRQKEGMADNEMVT